MFEENEFHQQKVVFVCLQTKRMYLFCKSISQSILHFLSIVDAFLFSKILTHTFMQRKLAVHNLINTQKKAETGRWLHWRRRHREYALWCFCQLHVGNILQQVFSFAFSMKRHNNRIESPMINWTWNWSQKNVPEKCFNFRVDDHKWVKREIIDFLESEQFGYKLCIHHRDFAPGFTINKNITTALKHSRRVITVASRYCVYLISEKYIHSTKENNLKLSSFFLKILSECTYNLTGVRRNSAWLISKLLKASMVAAFLFLFWEWKGRMVSFFNVFKQKAQQKQTCYQCHFNLSWSKDVHYL